MLELRAKYNNDLVRCHDQIAFYIKNNKNICWVIGFFIVASSLYIRSHMYVGVDPSFYYLTAERILNGERYYYDFFEPNFPLNFYIYTIPVIFNKITGIDPIPSFIGFITIVPIISIYFSSLILKKSSVYQDRIFYHLLIIGMFLGHFLPIATLCMNEIGTKTLLFLSFILPYLCYFFCEADGKKLPLPTTIIIGIFAGMAVCLKPHYVIFPIVMELYLLIKKSNFAYIFRPINLAILSVNILHLIWLIVFLPEFIFKTIPMLMVAYPGITDNFFLAFFKAIIYTQLFLIIILSVTYFKLPKCEWSRILLFAAIAAMIIFGIEALLSPDQKSLMYFFSSLLLIKIMLDLYRARSQNLFKLYSKILLCICFIFILAIYNKALTPNQYHLAALPKMIELKNKFARNEPIYIFSDKSYISLTNSSEYHRKAFSLTFLDGVTQTKLRNQLNPNSYRYKMALLTEKYLVDAEIEQIVKYKPKLIFFSNKRYIYDTCNINYIEYFNQFDAFRQAFQPYQFYDRILLTYSKVIDNDKSNIMNYETVEEDISVYIRQDVKENAIKQIPKFQGIFF